MSGKSITGKYMLSGLGDLNRVAVGVRDCKMQIERLQAAIDAERVRVSELMDTLYIDLEELDKSLPRFLPSLRFKNDSYCEYTQVLWDVNGGNNLCGAILTKIEDGFELFGIKNKASYESYDTLILKKMKK